MNDESDAILKKVWDMLEHHCKRNHTPVETLNRLFSENLKKWRRGLYRTRPYLDESNLRAREESWTVAELDKLERGHNKTVTQGPSDLPIIVVAYKRERRLIDGTTRINMWADEGSEKKHAVYVLEVVKGK